MLRWRLLSILLLVITFVVRLQAESKWIRMRTPNFDLISSASERDTRNTLQYFEQVREFFLKLNGHGPKDPAPIAIVLFGSEKEYATYRPNDFADAFFGPIGDRDYIVIGRTGEATERIAIHEYTHIVSEHAGLVYPPWLSEGIAELFSTFSVQNDSVHFADAIPGRILQLRKDAWVPLSIIMEADRNSPYYNESDKAGSLYNEGWAAVHMLATEKEYQPKFSQFLLAVGHGATSADALQQVYGKSLAAFETELRGYISQNEFRQFVTRFQVDRSKSAAAAEPLSPFDLKLTLTVINRRSGADAGRRRALEELKSENSSRPEPWAALAYLDWAESKFPQAIEGLSKAYSLGARSNRLLWDFGRLAQATRPQESVQALKDLAALEPNRAEVRIELAWSQYNARQFSDAAATLNGITIDNFGQAPRFYSALASVQLAMGDRTAAARTMDVLDRYAKSDADRAMAAALRRRLSFSAN